MENEQADFEMAIHNAANIVWPRIKIIGCRFHITQAWWRTIQKLALSTDYKKRSEVGKWIGYCFGLLFLEPQDVGDVYVFTLSATQPENDKVTLYADYLIKTYISEDAIFHPVYGYQKQQALLGPPTYANDSIRMSAKL